MRDRTKKCYNFVGDFMEKYLNINGNGCSIKCKLFSNGAFSFENVVICCHGFSGNKESTAFKKLAEKILPLSKSTAIIAYDLPCHGEDARPNIDLNACELYLTTLIDYARTKLKAANFYACCTSFGGYILLNYIHSHGNPFKKAVLRCPAVTMHKLITETIISADDMKKLNKTKSAMAGFDKKIKVTKKFIDELEVNDINAYDFSSFKNDLLIIHGTDDDIVPFDVVKQFAMDNQIPFIATAGADHRYKNPVHMSCFVNSAYEHFAF